MVESEVINIKVEVSKTLAQELKKTDSEAFEIFKTLLAMVLKTVEQDRGDKRNVFKMEPIK